MRSPLKIFKIVLLIICTAGLACSTQALAKPVHITFIQANDVYEMTPVNGGAYGGLARVQTLIKQAKRKNKHTYTVLAGDLISPSAYGTAVIKGKALAGEQMVDVLNAMGWDYITLGNHEFDNGHKALLERLAQAQFKVVSTNVLEAHTGKPFNHTITTDVLTVKGVKIGFAGITLDKLTKDFVTIQNPLASAQTAIEYLKHDLKVDIVILITHQGFMEDINFAQKLDDVDLIMGGHEHENMYFRRGKNLTPIAKADANAKSLYFHDLYFDKKHNSLKIESRLQLVTDKTPEDPTIAKRVDEWVNKAFKAFENDGFNPRNIIANTPHNLDGTEARVRTQSTALTQLVAHSAKNAFPNADAAILNAGSIRIDDVIPAGNITEFDVLRILPFKGGQYELVTMPGKLLTQTLEAGLLNQGKGGFLQYAGIKRSTTNSAQWLINDKTINPTQQYTVAFSEFLIHKGDENLGFLVNNPAIKSAAKQPADARKALIEEFKGRGNNSLSN